MRSSPSTRLAGRRLPAWLVGLAATLSSASASAGETGAGAAPLDAAASRFATLDGARVHYKSLGASGPALVFVHGWSCELGFWREQVPALAGRARLVLVDLPGHGASDKPELAYTPRLFGRAVVAVLDAAGVERAVLVGHSLGALVARHVLELAPERVSGLVVVDGSLRPTQMDAAEREAFLAPYRGAGYQQNAARYVEAMLGPAAPRELRADIQRRMLATPQHVMLSALEGLLEPAAWLEGEIRAPLVAITTTSPYWSGYEAYLRGRAPRVEYRRLAGVGHFLMLEAPAAFNDALVGGLAALELVPR